MNLNKLKEPFKEDQIEWRIGQCGKKANGPVWAMCLAYVQARAIMDRLDEVCEPGGWRVEYSFISGGQTITPGVIAKLSIKVGDEWVSKEDGAEQTDIEAFKGGISSALKRAASAWGIGRYLYGIESSFANVVPSKTNNSKWGKTKEGIEFHWEPPRLPAWALPPGAPVGISGRIHPEHPGNGNGNTTSSVYKIGFGGWKDKTIEEIYSDPQIGPAKMRDRVNWYHEQERKSGKPLNVEAQELVNRLSEFLGVMENKEIEQMRNGA